MITAIDMIEIRNRVPMVEAASDGGYLPLHEPLARVECQHGHQVAAHERQRVAVLVQREAGLRTHELLQRQRRLQPAAAAPPASSSAPAPAAVPATARARRVVAGARIAVQLQVHAICRYTKIITKIIKSQQHYALRKLSWRNILIEHILHNDLLHLRHFIDGARTVMRIECRR